MNDDDDIFGLTPEEIKLYFKATHERIKAVEEKALRRLLASDEEKELIRFWLTVKKDKDWQDLLFLMLIAFDWKTITAGTGL
jgi:hypothetical protein